MVQQHVGKFIRLQREKNRTCNQNKIERVLRRQQTASLISNMHPNDDGTHTKSRGQNPEKSVSFFFTYTRYAYLTGHHTCCVYLMQTDHLFLFYLPFIWPHQTPPPPGPLQNGKYFWYFTGKSAQSWTYPGGHSTTTKICDNVIRFHRIQSKQRKRKNP